MPRYSDHRPTVGASAEFGYVPGNYIVWLWDGAAYTGRQGPNSNRVGDALRRFGSRAISIQFMRDVFDDGCVRAAREASTKRRLEDEGVRLLNRIDPAIPRFCRTRW